jgi:hypothetical protein
MDSEWCVSTTTISPAIVHTNGYLVTINVLFPETVCHIQLYCPSDHHPPPRLSKAFFRNSAALRLAEFGIAIHLILVGSGCTFPTGIVHCAYMVPRRLNGFCTGRGVLSPSDPEGGGQLGGENPEEGGGGAGGRCPITYHLSHASPAITRHRSQPTRRHPPWASIPRRRHLVWMPRRPATWATGPAWPMRTAGSTLPREPHSTGKVTYVAAATPLAATRG